MMNNKGITLVSLTITILLLIILAGTITYSGINVYKNMLVENFISETKLVQEKVNLICDKYKVSGKATLNEYLESVGIKTDATNIDKAGTLNNKVSELIANGGGKENYLYFDKDALEGILGIKKLDQEILINFSTREVISLKGIKVDNQIYYRQYDLPYGDKIIEYADTENNKLSIEIKKKMYGLTAKLIVTPNIKENVEIYYGEKLGVNDNNEPIVSYWEEAINKSNNEYEINISKTANYVIKVKDQYGNEKTKEVNVTLVNSPELVNEFIPIKYNEKDQKWYMASEDDGDWYDYEVQTSNENYTSKWANAMLNDGRFKKKADGTIEDSKEGKILSSLKNVSIEESELGSIFVWIPRYMYKIEADNNIENSGCNTSNAGIINIKFLKGTTSIPTDNTKIDLNESITNENWHVHPAFENGIVNSFENGEWDEEITGFWIAKYETSRNDATNASIGESKTLKIQSNVKPISQTNFVSMYTEAKDFTEKLNSHLMKDSEYGAVAYLAYSEYGRNRKEAESNNVSNTEKLTGFNYKGDYANTTTGNIYGIYDFDNNLPEIVAISYKNSEKLKEETYKEILKESENAKKSTKYLTLYADTNNVYGDALNETSDKTTNKYWNR